MKNSSDYLKIYNFLNDENFSEYNDIYVFCTKNSSILNLNFNKLIEKDIVIFSTNTGYDFEKYGTYLDLIIAKMPYIKQIFKKPIIHLKENSEILPLEAIVRVNNSSINHLACHSENIGDITDKGIVPSKLLTEIYNDDYSIYENLIFCNLIDEIISFLKRNIRILEEIMYVHVYLKEKNDMLYNFYETVNHWQFYIALGKLQSSYMRDVVKYIPQTQKYLDLSHYLLNSLTSRLKRPVYSKNKKRNKNLKLRKTNILGKDKNYSKIYDLYKKLGKEIEINRKNEELSIDFDIKYFYFLEFLFIFSITNFNFEADPNSLIAFDNLDINFRFKDWVLTLKANAKKDDEILLICKNDKEYKVCFKVLLLDEKIEYINKEVDEVVFITPNEDFAYKNDYLFISSKSIESFRRLQQVIQRAMIHSDASYNICSFCGKDYAKKENDDEVIYECHSCRNVLHLDKHNEKEPYTTVLGFKPTYINKDNYSLNKKWLYYRDVESIYHFRNIIPCDEKGNFIFKNLKK